jgi:large subunit ribosomal protein L31
MKEGIHPKNYRKVVFKDMSNDHMFICQSTVDTKETIQYEDGNEYPLFKLDISYKSHPFFTGQSMFIDTAGRIDKFKRRYQKKAD